MKAMGFRLFSACLLIPALAGAEPRTLYFSREEAGDVTTVMLAIDGDKVTGNRRWQPREGHGANGTLDGIVNGDVMQVLYSYTIEGSDQVEEQVYKLKGDILWEGEGELVDAGDGRLNLKEPNKVGFEKSYKPVVAHEPAAGSAERKAIMDAMRGPLTEQVGKAVVFTGDVLVSGSWARFRGNVATKDGSKPSKEDVAMELDLDFFALLRKSGDGSWQVVHHGFAGDIGVSEAAREKFPKAPWMLFE